jgi:flagellar hook-associated protein 3 FlgL
MTITNGADSATISLTSAMTVEDLLNAINGSGTAARAEINATGTGINLLNPTQGTLLGVAEAGGSTASQLGLRSFGSASPLTELNAGRGVRTVDGADFRVADSSGAAFDVDVTGLTTVQDVIDAINTAATAAGAGVTASFATTGNGIVLTDTAGGAGTLALTPQNFSDAPADLGITAAAAGNVITGTDVNPVKAVGIFANLSKLRASLTGNDQRGITEAAEGLAADTLRVTRVRGETGARVQELEDRQDRLADQNVTTKALLSTLEETDYTEAITRFQTLQTALQAGMQTTARVLNLSLMDFIG